MSYQCSQYKRDFSCHTALRNHIKTHESEIDRILREIAEESEEEVERNDEESGRVSGEKMIIIEEESEDEMNDEVNDEDQLLEENKMNDDYYINEELVDVQEEEMFDVQEELVDVQEELVDIQEEELVNVQEEMIVVQEELVEDDGSNDQVRFSLIYTTLVVQNILSDLLYYILY